MRVILTILFVFFCGAAISQTRPSGFPAQKTTTWHQFGYVGGDSAILIARRDTLGFLPRFSGSLVMRPQDRSLYYYDSTSLKWNKLLIISDIPASQNFANTDLTLTGNRNHTFGTNSMRFGFQYTLGNNGYIGFNETGRPGIVIYSKSDVETPGLHFIDPDQPTAEVDISNFLGTLTLNASSGTGLSGNIAIGGNNLTLSILNASALQKSINFAPSFGLKGIRIQDQQDSTGFAYDTLSIPASVALSKAGRSWIPNWGAVIDAIESTAIFYKQNGNSFGDTARLGTNDNYSLIFETNNTRRAIINEIGRVGIGTLSPVADLDITRTTGNSILYVNAPAGNGTLSLGSVSGSARINFDAPTATLKTTLTNFIVDQPSAMGAIGSYDWVRFTNQRHDQITGSGAGVVFTQRFAPASGTANFTNMLISGEIDQQGGANGITRGLYISPTLTNAVDWRSIQTDAGNILFNTISGRTSIGLATNTALAKLHVVGTGLFTDTLTATTMGTPDSSDRVASTAWVKRQGYGSGGGGGGVTNVGTGYGLLGGPITTTGTIIADSATLALYFLRRKDSTLYATSVALKDSMYRVLNSIPMTAKIEFIQVGNSTTYTNTDLIGKYILMVSGEGYIYGTLTRTSGYYSFDAGTGTITIHNSQFSNDDYVLILYRTTPIYLTDGMGNYIVDSNGNYIIVN